jgi:hypothetical protein
MDGKILGIALIGLGPALSGTAPAYAQEVPHIQPKTTMNPAVMNLDRCPYYPSQAVCRAWGIGSAVEHNSRGRG